MARRLAPPRLSQTGPCGAPRWHSPAPVRGRRLGAAQAPLEEAGAEPRPGRGRVSQGWGRSRLDHALLSASQVLDSPVLAASCRRLDQLAASGASLRPTAATSSCATDETVRIGPRLSSVAPLRANGATSHHGPKGQPALQRSATSSRVSVRNSMHSDALLKKIEASGRIHSSDPVANIWAAERRSSSTNLLGELNGGASGGEGGGGGLGKSAAAAARAARWNLA